MSNILWEHVRATEAPFSSLALSANQENIWIVTHRVTILFRFAIDRWARELGYRRSMTRFCPINPRPFIEAWARTEEGRAELAMEAMVRARALAQHQRQVAAQLAALAAMTPAVQPALPSPDGQEPEVEEDSQNPPSADSQ